MTPLAALLRRRIEQGGPVTVAAFMAEAMGHPQHGYYMRADRFGAAGDFTTAPEISQLFGETLAVWAIEAWNLLGRPSPVLLVELGPGRGTLLQDLLRVAASVPEFVQAVRVHLVETSPVLRAAQAHRLAAYDPAWHDSVLDLPDGPLLLLANEFFDALPVRQFLRGADGWHERLVDIDPDHPDRFRFVAHDAVSPLGVLLGDGAAEGSIRELAPAGAAIAAEIGRRIHAFSGMALCLDYTGGSGDTLQALRQHQPVMPLVDPGEVDLTTHVDFANLLQAASGAGAATFGPLPQGELLQRLGMELRAATLTKRANEEQAAALSSAVQRLTGPDAMGVLFQAVAFGSRTATPPGF